MGKEEREGMDVLDGVSNDVLVFTTVCGAITAGVLVWQQHRQPPSNLDTPVSASGPSNQTTAPQILVTVRLNSASQGDLSLSLPAHTSISDLKTECLSRMDLSTSDKEIRIIRLGAEVTEGSLGVLAQDGETLMVQGVIFTPAEGYSRPASR